jgi:predicted enzyme related to lactoylglutathione lyase
MTGKTNDQIEHRHGDFIWYELMTGDVASAKAFYAGLLGWSFTTHDLDAMDYHEFAAGDAAVGGFMAIDKQMAEGGAMPMWAGYIFVENVDKAADAVASEGGAVYLPPFDVPDVGRIAFVADPQGAPFYIMTPASDEGPSLAFSAYQPAIGHCAWNELATSDPDAAKHWYGKLFGFVKDGSMDMGELGEYEFLRNAGQDFGFGAVMRKPAEMPVSMWFFYFRVADIDVAVEYIKANGGQIIVEPMEIPGGDYSLNGMDPQGAVFSLVGPRQG